MAIVSSLDDAEQIAIDVRRMLAERPTVSHTAMAAGVLLAAVRIKLEVESAGEVASWLDDVGSVLIERTLTGR